MSEAEKSTEIEDVLSSIRRLVADGSHPTSEPVKPVDVKLTPPEPQTEQEIKAEKKSKPDAKPASFVDKINASIAEIRQQAEEDTPKAKIEPQLTTATVEAVEEDAEELATEADQDEAASTEPVVVKLEKPEPLVLRADMAAKPEKAPVEAAEVGTDNEPDTVTGFQEIPEADEAEIVMPDDIEDDEVALETAAAEKHSASVQAIKEDALRDLVSEMVRAELQGDLGDRITRNVRKLVRREIHHALATRELD